MPRKMFGLCCLMTAACAQEMAFRNVAGPSSRGDGGPAVEALLDRPSTLAVSPDGDVFFAETGTGVIRRVRAGVVERVAGTGGRGDGPEGRPALETDLNNVTALQFNTAASELYFADSGTCRLRKIASNGDIRNVAGSGRCAGGGAGGGFPFPGGGLGGGRERLALEADLGTVSGIAFDSDGRMLFSESDLHQVRRLDADGYVRVVAGAGFAGYAGDGSTATNALLDTPIAVAADPRGNFYIADRANCRVRRVNSSNVISTIAGTGTCSTRATTYSNNTATRTAIGRATGMGYDPSRQILYLASAEISRVLRIDIDAARVSSLLGNGTQGLPDFERTPSQFMVADPAGVAVAPDGGVLIAAITAFQIYRLSDNKVEPFAGRWPDESTLLRPVSTCSRPDGSILILDVGAERILQRNTAGEYSVFAGAKYPTGFSGGDGGPATNAHLAVPRRIYCAADGSVYLSHADRIRVIDPDGTIRGVREGLSEPVGLALDAEKRLIFADAAKHQIFRYEVSSDTETVLAGTGKANFSGDGSAATNAELNSPGDLAFDGAGRLLIADRVNRRVRRLDMNSGRIETVIGSSREFSYIDITGEAANDVGLDPIRGIAAGADEVIYVAEANRLCSVSQSGRVTVLLGFAGEDDRGVRTQRVRAVTGLAGLDTSGGTLLVTVGDEGTVIRADRP